MKSIAYTINDLLHEEADAGGWFKNLTGEKRKEYLKNHPASKFAQHLEALPSVIKHKYHKLTENSKKAVADWHESTPDQRREKARNALTSMGKSVVHHAINHAKHEYHTYKGAGEAVKHLATGNSWNSMHPHHKKALKSAIVHAGITAGSMALGDPTGGGAHHAIASLASHFAMEHAHHNILEGVGKVAYKTAKQGLQRATSKIALAAAVDQEFINEKLSKNVKAKHSRLEVDRRIRRLIQGV